MEGTPDQHDITTDSAYEVPSLIELGSVVELTQGSGAVDTADMKQWYN
ncbi:MAG: lasso RiPP family leader peptide-containing protein [Pseudonocardiales bacterium]|nr:lasso RiPP family leader peptide-containing protein [Pseudonocardiales bacterium]